MTDEEARAILALVRSGKRFSTRVQEEGRGIEAAENGRFRLWSYQFQPDGTENSSDESLTEEQAVARLKIYGFERIKAGLR